MSAAKHTPGPWIAELAAAAVFDVYPSGEDSGPVACDCGEADARLIAAAPELLAIVQEVFVIGDRLVDDVYGHEFVQNAKAAIAKALGSTQ